MRLLTPLPRAATRLLSAVVLFGWIGTLAVLVHRSYLQASSTNLATDLARYGSDAQWRGVYYKGEKIGFTVNQILPRGEGFELQEDGRLQMSLLGAITAASIRTTALVDRDFVLESFTFMLDPGTGPLTVSGRLEGTTLHLETKSAGGAVRTEARELPERPALALSLGRRLAGAGLVPGTTYQWTIFDPATMQNAPVTLRVGERDTVDVLGSFTMTAGRADVVGTRPYRVPAFRVDLEFAGLRTTSWVTDTGETVREESPLGLMTIREPAENARRLAVPRGVQSDLLAASAVVPKMDGRIDDPRSVRRLRLELSGVNLAGFELEGVGQRVQGDVVEIVDARTLRPGPPDDEAASYLAPEPLIESDDPDIVAEAERAIAGVTGARARAERLTRHVNALLEKKPTVSLPSAREVLRTRIGDCNEHTALYVALARAVGMPARIAVGLAWVRGAFYYHAWPEVYIEDGGGLGLWLPVDPTFNEFPATPTRIRFARGGLDRQTAILPLLGRLQISVVDLEVEPGTVPVLLGRRPTELNPLTIEIPQRRPGGCWGTPVRR